MSLVECFLSGNLTEARKLIDERIKELFEQKLEIIKERIVKEESEKLGLTESTRMALPLEEIIYVCRK